MGALPVLKVRLHAGEPGLLEHLVLHDLLQHIVDKGAVGRGGEARLPPWLGL